MKEDQAKELACRIMDLSEQAMIVIDRNNYSVVYANAKAKAIFGEQMTNATCYLAMEGEGTPCETCPFRESEEKDRIVEHYFRQFDRTVQVKITFLDWSEGQPVMIYTILDSDELLLARMNQEAKTQSYEEQLRLSGELYQTVVSQLHTMVFEYNKAQNTYSVSPLFKEKFGIDEIHNINFLLDDKAKYLIYEPDCDIYNMLFTSREDDFREVTCRLRVNNGQLVWYRICIQFIRNDEGQIVRVIGTLKDVDDATRSYETLRYRSEFDMLTNIPNVNRFYVDAGRAIMEDERNHYAVISFDIDKFKLINDLFGMSTGDEVLKHIANVLRDRVPENGWYCRVHSDMFLICIPYSNRGDIIKKVEKIRKEIYKNSFSFDVNTTYGIYLVEDVTIPINLMCDRATLAARTVKGNAMNFCAFYDEQYRAEIIKNTEIERDMNAAISHKQFLMYLQPKYNLVTGKICGAEVLARWKHPVKGLIQPNDFIPLFERNGFILRLDEYMWEEACKTLARWRDEGRKLVPLSVNISRYHIQHNDLVGAWKRLIKKYRIPTSYLTLEITETFFYDSKDLYEVLEQLQAMGFLLEVDDFGAGYSSLNMIRQIPVDTIKIDKDFLDKKLSTEKGKIVISHTIAMAKDLKLGVIAEGVETKEHVDFLKSSSCDVAQGFFFAKPMPVKEFEHIYFEEDGE